MQKQVEQYEKQYNSYEEVVEAFSEGFVMNLFKSQIIQTVDTPTLQKWFNNPDQYMDKIINLLTYFYIIDGNVFQLYDMVFSLPELNFKITHYVRDENTDEDEAKIRQYLERELNHKSLTRDLLVHLASRGTMITTWLGGKNNPYLHVFDNLDYVYPYGRAKGGKMIGVVDLKWLDAMSDLERLNIFENLKPMVTKTKYLNYKNKSASNGDMTDKDRYVPLSSKKSQVSRIHNLSRDQRLGMPMGTQTLFDIQHKQSMKDLESVVAQKIMKAVAILSFKGRDDNDGRVSEGAKRKVYNSVKRALGKNSNSKEGITCIGLPDFAEFEFGKVENGGEVFNPDKYESVDNDIGVSTGLSTMLSTGSKVNSETAKMNLVIFYRKIAVLLEQVETIYNQLIDIIIGKRSKNYKFEYDKDAPITKERKMQTLEKLQAQGFSTKELLDIMGINSKRYFEDTIYEIEDLKLREKVIPPQNTNNLSSDSDLGTTSGTDNVNPTDTENTSSSTGGGES